MNTTVRHIVFDIGGVLADFRIKEFLRDKGFDGDRIRRILRASVLNPCWSEYERGEISEEEALAGFAGADPGIEQDLRRAFSSLEGMLTIRDYAIALVKSLKAAGLGVFYLSNYSEKAFNECGESLAFMPFMDGGLVSFRAHLTKPDPEMYRLFLRTYRLLPGECLFIDDREENVAAARSLGFQVLHFQDYENLRLQLREVLPVSLPLDFEST